MTIPTTADWTLADENLVRWDTFINGSDVATVTLTDMTVIKSLRNQLETYFTFTTIFDDAGNSRVGINTMSPSTTLDVNGTATATLFAGSGASLTALNATNLSTGTVNTARLSGAYSGITGLGTLTALTVDNIGVDLNTISTTSGALNLTPLSGQNLNVTVAGTGRFAINSSQFYLDPSTGFVGIGTASPLGSLDTNGMLFSGELSGWPTYASGAIIGKTGGSGSAPFNNAGSLVYRARLSDVAGRSDHIFFTGSVPTERLRIKSDGEVGIGTASPDALLSVNGVASFGAGTASLPSIAAFGDLNTGAWFPAADTFAVSTGGSERLRVTSAGNVGIGTTSPGTLLDVSSGASPAIRITNTTNWTGSSGNIGALQFYTTDSSTPGGARVLSEIECYNDAGSSVPSGVLVFKTALGAGAGAAAAERMWIDSAGNVGIGTAANANAILDVSSTTKAFMPPRMTTTQKNAIASPTAGMVVYDSTLNKLCVYTTAWETITSS